jgi:hypothetical protein
MGKFLLEPIAMLSHLGCFASALGCHMTEELAKTLLPMREGVTPLAGEAPAISGSFFVNIQVKFAQKHCHC